MRVSIVTASAPRRQTAIAFVLYLFAAVVMTWPIARHLGTRLAADLADPPFVCWVLAWDAGQILAALHGDLRALGNFWNGNIFYPERLTLAYSEHFTGQALQILPIYAATGNILLAYNLLFLSTFVLSGLAVFLLVRELTGRPLAAFLAGLAFAYAPYRMGQFSHLQVLSSYWMPLALFGFRRYFTRLSSGAARAAVRRPLAGAAAALVMQNLSCGYYMIFFSPFAAAYCLYEVAARRLARRPRVWLELGAAALVVALLTWPFVRPYLQLRALNGLGVRALDDVLSYSADTHAFATSAVDRPWLGGWMAGYPKAEGDGFPGFTILAFAAVGLAWGVRRRLAEIAWSRVRDWHTMAISATGALSAVLTALFVWIAAVGNLTIAIGGATVVRHDATPILKLAAAVFVLFAVLSAIARRRDAPVSPAAFGFFAVAPVVAALLALGPRMQALGRAIGTGPYALLFEHVPGFDGLRVPARFIMLVVLFLSVLAGMGAAALLRTRRRGIAAGVVCLGMAGILAEGWVAPAPMNLPAIHADDLTTPPPVETGRSMSRIYRVIRDLPGPMALVELPFGDPAYDVLATFYAGYHRRPILNGYSGFFPVSYGERQSALGDVPNGPNEAAAMLHASGATHVLVHEAAFLGARGPAVSAWLTSIGARLVTSSGTDKLFVLP